MIKANKSWENGNKENQEFETLAEAAKWLAESPEAGVSAIDYSEDPAGIYVDQHDLCEMIEKLQ